MSERGERQGPRAPKGTADVLATESARWHQLLATVADVARRAGFGRLRSPLVEDGAVVRGAVGDAAIAVTVPGAPVDLALAPGVAVGAARAFAQHQPATPWKVWSLQTGLVPTPDGVAQRNELGAQALGSLDPDLDVEAITLAADVVAALGVPRPTLVLNSLGTISDRRRYVEALRSWLLTRADALPEADRRRVGTAPLQVLGSDDPTTRTVLADAPRALDTLSDEARRHLAKVQEGVGAAGIDYLLDHRVTGASPHAVHVAFELQAADETVLVRGCRHEGLVEDVGGPAAPGVGWATTVEALVAAAPAADAPSDVEVFVVDLTGGAVARDLARTLRREGIRADRAFDDRSMRAQMKAADRSGAALALIVGEQEQAEGLVAVRHLRGPDEGSQTAVPHSEVLPTVRTLLG